MTHDENDTVQPSPTNWNVHTYRSRTIVANLDPEWNLPEDEFVFSVALPVHLEEEEEEDEARMSCLTKKTLGDDQDDVKEEDVNATNDVNASYNETGPPIYLCCAVYNKCKLRSHPFMGRAKVFIYI